MESLEPTIRNSNLLPVKAKGEVRFRSVASFIKSGNVFTPVWSTSPFRLLVASPVLITDKAVALFEKFNVFTRAELISRSEILYDSYAKALNIEARAMIDMAGKQIIPAVIKYTTALADSINSVKAACDADVSVQTDLLKEVSSLLAESKNALKNLTEIADQASAMAEGREQAICYRDQVKTAMDALRAPVDKLEMIVDKDMWPMPSYGDLIFEV